MTAITIRPKFSDAANVAGRLTFVVDLPALRGSEQQIAWATEIRATKLVEFAEDMAKRWGVVWGCVLPTDTDHIAKTVSILDEKLANPQFAPLHVAIAKIFANDDCRFWIDNRTDSFHLMFNAVMKG